MITTAHWYNKNSNTHKELNFPHIQMEIIRNDGTWFKNRLRHQSGFSIIYICSCKISKFAISSLKY